MAIITDEDELDLILEEKFTNTFRKGYLRVNGITMPLRYDDFRTEIENFKVYDDDIWIFSFPKSGTTWTQELVWILANNFNYKGAETNLGFRFPFLEVSAVFDYRTIIETNPDFLPLPYIDNSFKFVENLKRPRFIKSHIPWKLLPMEIRKGYKKPKIIYVARNPKDTCVSYYHHCRLLEGYCGNFIEFCSLFLSGKVPFSPYWENVLDFWHKRDEENILFLKYEELREDLGAAIERVAKFLNKEITEEQMDKFKNHLSFESMKNNPSVNYEVLVDLNKKFKLVDAEGSFMRSGTVGNYKGVMSPEIIKEFDKWISKNLENTGLTF